MERRIGGWVGGWVGEWLVARDCVERVLDYFKGAVCTVEGFGDSGEGVSDVVEGVLRCHVGV